MLSLSTLLPQADDGYLPYFLVLITAVGLSHSAVCYTSPPELSMKQFSGPARPPPNTLLAHVYAFTNMYTAMIRVCAAYDISHPTLYGMALVTWVGVILLNGSEWVVYGTARRRECVPPLITSTIGLVWMLSQWGYYTGQ